MRRKKNSKNSNSKKYLHLCTYMLCVYLQNIVTKTEIFNLHLTIYSNIFAPIIHYLCFTALQQKTSVYSK